MKKNVAFLIPSMRNGGAERVLSNMSTNFSDNINQKIIVWDGKDVDYPFKGELVDIDIQNKDNIIGNVLVLLNRIIKVKKEKNKNDIQTTISFLEGPNIVNILGRKRDKVIVSVHNFQSKERKGIYGTIFKMLIKQFYNKADVVVSVSEQIKNDLIENFKIEEDKVKVIYNPFDIAKIQELMTEEIEDEYKEIFKHPVIINAGRLTNQKGQWHLIKTFKEVKKTVHDAKLVILGQGELETELKKLCNDLDLNKDIHFLGFQKNPFKFIHRADVFALTSLFEGFPMCIAESMVCETAIVSTDCKSGPREMLYNKCDIYQTSNKIENADYGILSCPFNDEMDLSATISEEEKEFAKGIVKLLEYDNLRKDYVKKAKERVKVFDVSNILKQWEEII